MTWVSISVTRLVLVSHAVTPAQRRARFESDEPVAVAVSGTLPRADRIMVAPELRTRQTAVGLGLEGEVAPELADLDHGAWRGTTMDQHPESDIVSWLTDTGFSPPGGESIDGLFERIGSWLNRIAAEPGNVCAVTHPAVVRAAVVLTLDAPRQSFWRVDIPPLTSTTVHHRSGRWTLRSTAEKIS